MKQCPYLLLIITLIIYSSTINASADGLQYNMRRKSETGFRSSSLESSLSRQDLTPTDESPLTRRKSNSPVSTFFESMGSMIDNISFFKKPKPQVVIQPPIIKQTFTEQEAQYFVRTTLNKELFKKIALFRILNDHATISSFSFELPDQEYENRGSFIYIKEFPFHYKDIFLRQELVWAYPTDILAKLILKKNEYHTYIMLVQEIERSDDEDCMILLLKKPEEYKLFHYLYNDKRETSIKHAFINSLLRVINLYKRYISIKSSTSLSFNDKEFIATLEKNGLLSLISEKLETYQTIKKLNSQYFI